MIVKHATASVFLFAAIGSAWHLGLIYHPRFRRWMIPGGHVESHENPAETAQREVTEETGLHADLFTYPTLSPAGQLEQPVITPPLRIIEEFVLLNPSSRTSTFISVGCMPRQHALALHACQVNSISYGLVLTSSQSLGCSETPFCSPVNYTDAFLL
ncbi:MAG: NUDIX domain-containing protein [Egibacteraceae bacterium]